MTYPASSIPSRPRRGCGILCRYLYCIYIGTLGQVAVSSTPQVGLPRVSRLPLLRLWYGAG
jgi:hypothetical protein